MDSAFDIYWNDLPKAQGRIRPEEGPDIAALKRMMVNHGKHFAAHYKLLSARIEAEPQNAAARGLVAAALQVNLIGTTPYASRYHRVRLLNDVALRGSVQIAEPPGCPCDLFTDTPCLESYSGACQGRPEDLEKVTEAVVQLLVERLEQIEAVNPESKWLSMARAFERIGSYPARGAWDSTGKTLFSKCLDPPSEAVSVTLSKERILCDESPVMSLENGRVPEFDLSSGGYLIDPLFQKMQEAGDHYRRVRRFRGGEEQKKDDKRRETLFRSYLGMGIAHWKEKAYDTATDWFEKAVAEKAKAPEVYEAVGLMWIERGYGKEANTQLEHAEKLYRSDNRGRSDRLEEFYERVITAYGTKSKSFAKKWSDRRNAQLASQQ
ncbi:hypothetical protein ACFL6C_11555 [Myxococcota bacterium]